MSGDSRGCVKLWLIQRGVLLKENDGLEVLSLEVIDDGSHVLAVGTGGAKVLRLRDLAGVQMFCLIQNTTFYSGIISGDTFCWRHWWLDIRV